MKKFLLALILLTGSLFAQQTQQTSIFTSTSATSGTTLNLVGTGINYFKIAWTASGTVSTCVLKVDSSTDGVSFNDGDILGATTCTGNGVSSFLYFSSPAYIRVRTSTAVTGSGSSTTTVFGYTTPPVGSTLTYSPTQLGVNALTLPASLTTALSAIIDMRGVRAAALQFNCGQIAHVLWTEYTEDGTSAWNGSQLVTSANAGANCTANIATESSPSTNCGTIGTNRRFPTRAIALSFTNTTATPSTCTARLFVQY